MRDICAQYEVKILKAQVAKSTCICFCRSHEVIAQYIDGDLRVDG
jgi:hypothetical protein